MGLSGLIHTSNESVSSLGQASQFGKKAHQQQGQDDQENLRAPDEYDYQDEESQLRREAAEAAAAGLNNDDDNLDAMDDDLCDVDNNNDDDDDDSDNRLATMPNGCYSSALNNNNNNNNINASSNRDMFGASEMLLHQQNLNANDMDSSSSNEYHGYQISFCVSKETFLFAFIIFIFRSFIRKTNECNFETNCLIF